MEFYVVIILVVLAAAIATTVIVVYLSIMRRRSEINKDYFNFTKANEGVKNREYLNGEEISDEDKNRSMNSNRNDKEIPKYLIEKDNSYYSSFVAWTIVQYLLMLVPIFTSTATLYFTTEFLQSSGKNDKSAVLMVVMSFLTALLPLISSRILPKTHADGFYHAFTKLEQGLLKYINNEIEIKALLNIAEEAERYSNPLANTDFKKKEEVETAKPENETKSKN